MIDLDAIRARDRDYSDIFEEQSHMSPDIAHRLVSWPVADRRALLAYVDALRAAAGKVTCRTCGGDGSVIALHYIDTTGEYRTCKPCPDCSDLRKLMGEKP